MGQGILFIIESKYIFKTREIFIVSTFLAINVFLLPEMQGRVRPVTSCWGMTPWFDGLARWWFVRGLRAGAATDTLPGV
ncbi:hypothetical protein ACVGXY_00170, partial [Enterobacter intestinihominis]